jgi:hypothetical protein
MKILKLLLIGMLLLLSIGYMVAIFDLSPQLFSFSPGIKLFGLWRGRVPDFLVQKFENLKSEL